MSHVSLIVTPKAGRFPCQAVPLPLPGFFGVPQETLPQCARERLALACSNSPEGGELGRCETDGHLGLPLTVVRVFPL